MEKASCGETVVQNAKMDSNLFSISFKAFRCSEEQDLRLKLAEKNRDSPKTSLCEFGRPFLSHSPPSPLFWAHSSFVSLINVSYYRGWGRL